MKTNKCSIPYIRFFDSVLAEIELGRVEPGINMLAGMLDALAMQEGSLEVAAACLTQHMLHQILLEDPVYRAAAHQREDAKELAAASLLFSHNRVIGTTGKRMIAATGQLPIARALSQRHLRFEHLIAAGKQSGLRIGILATPSASTKPPILSHSGAADTSAQTGARFDLICAPDLADMYDDASLFAHLDQQRNHLAPGGRIVFSALLADHLGSGWRRACLHWHAHTHDEAGLGQRASRAGFTAKIYRHESDCAAWGELRIAAGSQNLGEQNHAN